MSARTTSKQLREHASLVLKDRKYAHHLQNILASIQEYDTQDTQPSILTLEMIFTELLKRREVGRDKGAAAAANYAVWLGQRYERTFNRLLLVLRKHSSASQLQALSTMMKLLAVEGQYPLEDTQKGEFYFPVQRLQFIVLALLSSEQNMSYALNRFQEYTSYNDVLHFVWKMLPNIALSQKKPAEIFIKNFLHLIEKIPVPKEEEVKNNPGMILCAPLEGTNFVVNVGFLRKMLNRTWGCVMHWDHTPATLHVLLLVLLERVLHHLDDPLSLADFLMDSLDIGGPVSVLALQGIYLLIQKYNLNYPTLFTKLYSMFEPEIFHTKFKGRLFYLSDTFLSSTHLPETLVAAFAKRMARLTLVAPPQDILAILMFIGNLILRHPGLKRLVNHPIGGKVVRDPYIMDECDPLNSYAIESSLWELQTLQTHKVPGIATAARFINSALPLVEWDLTKILEETPDDMFVKESKKKVKEIIALTFEKPHSMELQAGERLLHYWDFS